MANERGHGAGPRGQAAGASTGARPPIDRRQLLKGAGAGSLLLSAAGVVGACGSVSAAGGGLQPAQNRPGTAPPPPPGGLPSVPSLRDTFGATGGGADDDALALAGVPPGTGVLLTPGVYRVASGVTIRYHMWIMPGAVLRPDRGATITWAPGCSITAGDYQIFDDSAGGSFLNAGALGAANAMWFPGTTSGQRDLGKQLNAAFDADWKHVRVPAARDHVIYTTVNVPMSATIEFEGQYWNHTVSCRTSHKPVFEMIRHARNPGQDGARDCRIRGGAFRGSDIQTPSCFLLIARPEAADQQIGDTTPLTDMFVHGSWGVGVVVSIAAEVNSFRNCALWIQGKGDSPWAGDRATIVMMNRDYMGVPWTHNQPRIAAVGTPSRSYNRSHSANSFIDCDIRAAGVPCFLFCGQVEDTTIQPLYLTCSGIAIMRFVNGDGQPVRRVCLRGGGRVETQGAPLGVPLILVESTHLWGLSIEDMSLFIGYFNQDHAAQLPVIRATGSGSISDFEWHCGYLPYMADIIIDHPGTAHKWNVDVKDGSPDGTPSGTRVINVGAMVDSLIIHRDGTINSGALTRSKKITNMSTL